MKKTSHVNTLNHLYNANRKGAKYSLNNGETWCNHGEYAECLAKKVLGYDTEKDANTRFDKAHDINEINASIKSWKCSLTDMPLADNFDEYVEKFFAISDDNTTYIMVNDYADMVDLYYMNAAEFRMFVEKFGSWEKSRNKVRLEKAMSKMVIWMESNL